MADDAPRILPLHLSWIGVLCGSLLFLLGDLFPVRLTFVRPDTLFLCLLQVEIAYLVFVWPLFIPGLAGGPGAPARRSAPRLLREGGLLLVTALPLALIAANVSNVGVEVFAGSLALLAALMAFAAALLATAGERRWLAGPWYVLGTFLLSALLPFIRFVAGGEWAWLSRMSPFWSAGIGDLVWPAAIYGTLAALLALAAFSRKGMDAPATPG